MAAVTTVFAGLALMATPAGSDPDASATSGSEAASTDLLGAFERLSVPAHEEARPKDESSSFPATSPPSDGYESIEAMAPGRRT